MLSRAQAVKHETNGPAGFTYLSWNIKGCYFYYMQIQVLAFKSTVTMCALGLSLLFSAVLKGILWQTARMVVEDCQVYAVQTTAWTTI